MRKKLIFLFSILAAIIVAVALVYASKIKKTQTKKEAVTGLPKDYTLSYSEGSCKQANECVYAGEGCGGGHGFCTSSPEKYKDVVTTCDIVAEHPINQGYSCTCIKALERCGWTK